MFDFLQFPYRVTVDSNANIIHAHNIQRRSVSQVHLPEFSSNIECLATLSSPSLFFFTSPKKVKSKTFLFFFSLFISYQPFYITIQFLKKKNPLQNKTFSLFYKTIPNFFILYITSITSCYYLNKNSITRPFTKHTHSFRELHGLRLYERSS
jgi:hypothetical protein